MLLRLGSKGIRVKELQRLLNTTGAVLTIDGQYGARTESAVKAFQSRVRLVVDGIAGPQTMTALKRFVEPPKKGRPEPDKTAVTEGRIPNEGDLKTKELPPPNNLRLLYTSRPINELIWHCTATPEGKDFTVSDIRAWHKARGWSDIGYHYVVYRDGRIMAGRPIGQVGAHVSGHNTGTIGAVYVGGVSADGKTAKDTRTESQKESMIWLTKQLISMYPIKKISGHYEYANKACPSFNVQKDALGRLL